MIGRRSRRLGLSLGPVFAYEWMASARRWQAYALRSLFLLMVLLALTVIWNNNPLFAYQVPLEQLAYLSQQYFLALGGTQLAVVLLAAPAATAGAICLDRSRGTLSHMLLTDLSDAEIVLGKLAARLVPVLTLIACTLPVMELLTLIGGLDPGAILGAFAITVGVAVLSCSLAMFFSLWLHKTHEALLWTYAVCGLWLGVAPACEMLGYSSVASRKSNPFLLGFRSSWSMDEVFWTDYLWFLAITVSISAVLIAAATDLRARRGPEAEDCEGGASGLLWRLLSGHLAGLTPSLDRNPVLWREWHRGRPSLRKLLVIVFVTVLATSCSLQALVASSKHAIAIVNGLEVALGLLVLTVTSSTSLAEERARGSLDILLSTPLSTRQIVLGKWLAAFRIVPLLAIHEWLIIAAIGYVRSESSWSTQLLMIGYLLSAGAAITSLGLLMATWFSRPARAIGMTVAIYVAVAAGSLGTVLLKLGRRGEGLAMASPYYWVNSMTSAMVDYDFRYFPFADWAYFWMGLSGLAGLGLLLWIMADFDLHLGRSDDLLARVRRPSRRVRIAMRFYFAVAAIFYIAAIFAEARWEIVLAFTATFFTLGKIFLSMTAARPLNAELLKESDHAVSSRRISAIRIVMARWLRAYRLVLLMVLLPALFVLLRRGPTFIVQPQFSVIVAFMLLQNAAVVSFGVTMATWFNRRGLAVFLTLLACAMVEVLGLIVADRLEKPQQSQGVYLSSLHVGEKMSFEITLASTTTDDDLIAAVARWSMGYGLASLVLLIPAFPIFARRRHARRTDGPHAGVSSRTVVDRVPDY